MTDTPEDPLTQFQEGAAHLQMGDIVQGEPVPVHDCVIPTNPKYRKMSDEELDAIDKKARVFVLTPEHPWFAEELLALVAEVRRLRDVVDTYYSHAPWCDKQHDLPPPRGTCWESIHR